MVTPASWPKIIRKREEGRDFAYIRKRGRVYLQRNILELNVCRYKQVDNGASVKQIK